ncbi:MAG: hypothetical protein QOE36_2421, partial [Gaiellaceae bacterium]|nr:hypothetical protein [Gaiellaceae bacterium]
MRARVSHRASNVAAVAAAVGIALFLLACALPRIGLARGDAPAPVFQLYGDRAAAGKIPYRDYSLEYPPGALAAIVPPSLAAADRYGFWFKALEILFGSACVGLVAVCLALLGASTAHAIAATAFVALAPLALGSVVLERFDLWPTALLLGGLAALLGGRAGLGGAALGLGTVTKLFPVVLLPLGLLYLARRAGAGAVRRALVGFAAAAAVVLAPFVLLGPGGVAFSVERQSGRALQIESVGSALLLGLKELGAYTPHAVFSSGSWNLTGGLAAGVGGLETVLQIAAVAAVWLLFAR